MKNKKTVSFIGIAALALYFIVYIIEEIISMVVYSKIPGYSILPMIGAIFKNIIIFGLLGFYLIYDLLKKSDNYDRLIIIFLLIIFGYEVLSNIRGLGSSIVYIIKAGKYLNGLNIVGNILNLVARIANVGIFALIGLNILGLLIKKKLPFKMFTFISWGLMALIFVINFINSTLALIQGFSVRNLIICTLGIIALFFMTVFKASLNYVIYDKTKGIK